MGCVCAVFVRRVCEPLVRYCQKIVPEEDSHLESCRKNRGLLQRLGMLFCIWFAFGLILSVCMPSVTACLPPYIFSFVVEAKEQKEVCAQHPPVWGRAHTHSCKKKASVGSIL